MIFKVHLVVNNNKVQPSNYRSTLTRLASLNKSFLDSLMVDPILLLFDLLVLVDQLVELVYLYRFHQRQMTLSKFERNLNPSYRMVLKCYNKTSLTYTIEGITSYHEIGRSTEDTVMLGKRTCRLDINQC